MNELKKINYKTKLSYDPDDVNIRLQHFRIFELIAMVRNESLSKDDFKLLDEIKNYKNEKKSRQQYLFDGDESIDLQGDDGLQRNVALWTNSQKVLINLQTTIFAFL